MRKKASEVFLICLSPKAESVKEKKEKAAKAFREYSLLPRGQSSTGFQQAHGCGWGRHSGGRNPRFGRGAERDHCLGSAEGMVTWNSPGRFLGCNLGHTHSDQSRGHCS